MKKVLITGIAGFIGSHIAESLVDEGFKIFGIDKLIGNYSKDYYIRNLRILKKIKAVIFKKDLLDKDFVYMLIKKYKYDFIIHCAAKTNVRLSHKYSVDYLKNNVIGTQILLEAVRRYSLNSRLIVLSSSAVYGKQNTVPFKEDFPLRPISIYGLSKVMMEKVVKFYSERFLLKTVVLRPFSIYGPRGREDMLPLILMDCVKNNKYFIQYGDNSTNKRDWTYIEDFLYVVKKILRFHKFKHFEVFNVGSSRPVGIESFIRIFSKLYNKKIKVIKRPLPEIEMNVTHADISKIKSHFGYSPKTSLEVGLSKLIEFTKGTTRYVGKR